MRLRAGRLRHRLVLKSKTITQNAYGEEVESYTTEATVWGAIEPLTGREYNAAQYIQAEEKTRIVIRYYAGIDTSWRIVHGSVWYDIGAVMNDNTRDRMMVLMVREGVAGTSTSTSHILLENGSALLLENGDNLLLET
jgi:SPP1 family predicted phage head-tail adaptor